jgi:hypothetical protein
MESEPPQLVPPLGEAEAGLGCGRAEMGGPVVGRTDVGGPVVGTAGVVMFVVVMPVVGSPVGGRGPIPCRVRNIFVKDVWWTPWTVKPMSPKACPRSACRCP